MALSLGMGTTSQRPTLSAANAGGFYFDTTLDKPVWVNAAGTAWVDSRAAIEVRSGSLDTTLALTDAGKIVEVNSSSNRTVTIPPNSSVAFPIGTIIDISRQGTGTLTVAAGAGVTLNSAGSLVSVSAQYAEARLRKRAADTWILTGSLA